VYRRRVFECRHQPFPIRDDLAIELAKAYGEPHRAYHNATHIAELLGWFDRVADDVGWRDAGEVYAAILFHDAFYAPGALDNEARSAVWAHDAGLPVDPDRVGELILMTAQHGSIGNADRDAALFLDCDMAIVGAPAEQFARYDAAITKEFGFLPRDTFRTGRRAFLDKLLARPRIFLSDYFHALLDAQARDNLRTTIAKY
jgi:predicted metal-dependent HD superfamily phosphohydrolase